MKDHVDAANSVESFGYEQELKRSLSLSDLLVYGLVFIVPIAPIAVFGIVYNASHGMVPLVYLVGLVAMVFTALSYMALSRAFPVAGSVYTYAARSIGPAAGFFSGWAILLDYLLIPALTYVVIAIAMHSTIPLVPKPVWVVLLVTLTTLINYFGIETTARTNFVLLGLQLVLLLVFMSVGTYALSNHVDGAHLSLAPFYNPDALTPSVLFGALSLAVLSFLGFDAISTLSEESRDGPRAVSRATMLSLCICAVLFVAQTYLASLFVLGRTSFAPGAETDAAFYNIAATIGGDWLKYMLTIPAVLFAGIAGALTAQAATARLLYGMARDGQLPHLLAHVHPVRRVPDRAIYLIAVITLVLAIWLVDHLELLASMVSFGALLGFMMLHLAVMAHFVGRERSRNWLRHLVVPAVGLAIVVYVLVNAHTEAKIAGTLWMVAGLALFFGLKLAGRPTALPVEGPQAEL
jgi:amino acid transporter